MATTETTGTERPVLADVGHRYGKALIRTAWGLEIIAAAIGLFIALATAFATHAHLLEENQGIDASAWMTIFIGALPFLMVAIVELMKIPLATAFYLSQRLVWRLIFITSLVLLIVITFETMLNGFQRQYESRVFLITKLRTDLVSLDDENTETERRIAELNSITVDSVRQEYADDLSEIRTSREAEVAEIDKQRTDQLALVGLTNTATQQEEIARIREQIDALREEQTKEIAVITSSYQADSQRDSEAIQTQRDQLNDRILRLDERIGKLAQQRQNELRGCLFSCKSIKEDYTAREKRVLDEKLHLEAQLDGLGGLKTRAGLRAELDRRIHTVRSEFDAKISALENRSRSLAREIDDRESRSAETAKPVLAQLDARRQEVITDFQQRAEDAEARFLRRMQEAENRETIITTLQGQLADSKGRHGELRTRINFEAKDNQIYQITALWYGKESPVDVTKDELKFVSSIWFGSLSFVVAVIGTVLALAGLVLRYQDLGPRPLARRSAFGSVRRAAVEFRRWLRRRPHGPRIVIKEVPVEKIVFREVAKEVVVKEMVYVPLYTNDTTLLNIDYGVGVVKTDRGATSDSDLRSTPALTRDDDD